MSINPRAGQPARQDDLANIPRLVSEYYVNQPDTDSLVSFGTSGHRGSSFKSTFTEIHITAICQALAEYRQKEGINGPLYVGMDTHALSECAFMTAVEVLVANGVHLIVQAGRGYTPTPVISHAILTHNQNVALSKSGSGSEETDLADGIVITPSHNPPEDGGFKYNPPNGGPADGDVTLWIEKRANDIIHNNSVDVRSFAFPDAWASDLVTEYDFIKLYVSDLQNVVDMDAISKAKVRVGVDPMGGSGIAYWDVIAKTYDIDLTVVNKKVDPTFSFMRLDKDGKIRMDCSSSAAMAGLIELKDQFDVAVSNDPDYDRHGIVTPSGGLMNPNHYLCVAIHYLMNNRPSWSKDVAIGKTLVSSSMIDRIAKALNRTLREVPVGFKWFVDGLFEGTLAFGGEESAGASFLRKNGDVWSTDKDGIILALLAAEIKAVTGKDPAEYYADLVEQFGNPVYRRIDAPASVEQKSLLKNLSADDVRATELAGERILEKLTHASGNGAAIGGLKVVTENGWFAARPSGTEEIYKIYGESFLGEKHLEMIFQEAQSIVSKVFEGA